jgi:hypothetical protein
MRPGLTVCLVNKGVRIVRLTTFFLTVATSVATAGSTAVAQDADLAKKLSNPIASLVSVPFQFNYDIGYGPTDGHKAVMNIQPVIPFELNEDWNVISRTIVPVVWQNDIAGDSGTQFGLGDTLQSFFFSPKEPTAGGIIWGAGPAFLLPTATEPLLGGEKLGLGPTGVILKQDGPWTYGALANHLWSVAGDGGRADVSSTFLQPFISYTTHNAWTFALNTESTYDWESNQWSVPINVSVAKLVQVNKQPISLQIGARYWATTPENGPDGWAVRAGITFLFPK